jgi:UDP-N-acetylglucosamine diphosphorylase/glucosamine-1-phosphate N-acetyltransferase
MSRTILTIYEDEHFRSLLPLTYLRPVFELRCGARTLRERILGGLSAASVGYLVREELEEVWGPRLGGTPSGAPSGRGDRQVFLNGRALLLDPREFQPDTDAVWKNAEGIVGFSMSSARLQGHAHPLRGGGAEAALGDLTAGLPVVTVNAPLVKYPWDLVEANARCLERDRVSVGVPKEPGIVDPDVTVYGDRTALRVASGARVQAGTVIDVSRGPVLIDREACIRPPTVIDGPCYVGRGTLVDGAKLRPGVSVGSGCRISGEVEASIILDNTNKHHDGFLGHSYIGEWVNLGALTTNSDLKNNYRAVRVSDGDREIDTGLLKVGCFIGDHSKTGIGTLIGTGAVIGPFCNVFGDTRPVSGFVPPFSWGNASDGYTAHLLDKALATARVVLQRRGLDLTDAETRLWAYVFAQTEKERS